MRHLLVVPLLAAGLFGCSYEGKQFSYPIVPVLPGPSKERVLRHEADFTFRDHIEKKQYFLRVYEEPGFAEQLVTVVDFENGARRERLANLDEYDYAMKVFEEEWLSQPHNERLRYHQNLRKQERERTKSNIDAKVRFLRSALEDVNDKKEWEVDSKIRAIKDVPNSPQAKDLPFLEKESERLRFEIIVMEAQLKILEYKKWLADMAMTRIEG